MDGDDNAGDDDDDGSDNDDDHFDDDDSGDDDNNDFDDDDDNGSDDDDDFDDGNDVFLFYKKLRVFYFIKDQPSTRLIFLEKFRKYLQENMFIALSVSLSVYTNRNIKKRLVYCRYAEH